MPASGIITRKLSTGQTVKFNAHDERMVKIAYDYFAGFGKRQEIQTILSFKQEQIKAQRTRELAGDDHISVSECSDDDENPLFKLDIPTLQDMLDNFEATDHRITSKDIEALLQHLGATLPKRKIKTLIWEADEKGDWVIDWEEFQLTCYRNIHDVTGCEPNTFFRIIEFLTFDSLHKGFIVEDDCMDILFARYGSGRLEQEMHTIFGAVREKSGGNGSLSLSGYLEAISKGKGRRSLLF
mmetsp:Transcript_26432/g.26682  ORF Transcript_26432/g.26682 Transcript_26432/m.26682 type:complete len:240 (-) Transcript_26432:33-752(-)